MSAGTASGSRGSPVIPGLRGSEAPGLRGPGVPGASGRRAPARISRSPETSRTPNARPATRTTAAPPERLRPAPGPRPARPRPLLRGDHLQRALDRDRRGRPAPGRDGLGDRLPAFFLPLVLSVLELSSRYPRREGSTSGRSAPSAASPASSPAGPYWASNLPYLPSLLYFAAANALFAGGGRWQRLAEDRGYFLLVSSPGSPWPWRRQPGGARARQVAASTWERSGSGCPGRPGGRPGGGRLAALRAGDRDHGSEPGAEAGLKDVIFWSTIAFAFGGVEGASTMGEEIRDARRTVPRALVLGRRWSIAAVYILGDRRPAARPCPQARSAACQGILQAISRAGERLGLAGVGAARRRAGQPRGPGERTAWFAATARLPFVAGIDRYLPAAFARLHPRFGRAARRRSWCRPGWPRWSSCWGRRGRRCRGPTRRW